MNLVLVVAVISYLCYERADHNRYGHYFAEVFQHVDRSYVEPVDEQALFEGAVEGMLKRLDEYSSFISRREAGQFKDLLDGRFGGIGIEVSLDRASGRLTVLSPLIGSPAYAAGIRAGDKIVAIDGEGTDGFTLEDAVKRLRGPIGDRVTLRVRREGRAKPIDFVLTRAEINVASVVGDVRKDGAWSYWLPGQNKIGYLRVNQFGKKTFEELSAALDILSDQKARGVIIDLRNNPGGLLDSAKDCSELFLPEGKTIVTTRGRGGLVRETYRVDDAGDYQELPLVVIVNHYTASAAEIMAAALQDYHRAAIVGVRTWGKGTVQDVIPVEGGRSVLKLTIATYWRPSMKNIHRFRDSKETDEWGVKPDPGLEVPQTDKQLEKWMEYRHKRDVVQPQSISTPPDLEADPQLGRAIEALKKRLG